MKAYRITDWDKKFEVNKRGQPTTEYIPMDYRRKGELKFIRIPVKGLNIDPLLDEILSRGWKPGELFHWAVWGVYVKLVEIAADQEREYRGWLLDNNQKPIDAAYFAKRFREEPNHRLIAEIFDFLSHPAVNLLEIHEIPDFPENSGSLKNIPVNSGSLYKVPENSGTFINTTQPTQLNPTQHKTTQDAETARKVEIQKQMLLADVKKESKLDNSRTYSKGE